MKRLLKNLAVGVGGAVLALGTGCATGSGPSDPSTCIAVTTILGGAAGVVVANQGEGETDEKIAGGGAGAAAGAVLGYLICGEGTPAVESVSVRANPSSGTAPLRVNLTADVVPPGAATTYAWELGDGATAQGAQVAHSYANAGSYDVRVKVTDGRGRVTEGTARVQVDAPQAAATPEPVRRRVVLRGLNFATGSAELSDEAKQLVEVAIETLKGQPDVRVKIIGHTDSTASDEYNQGLSERRAASVRNAMVQEGIPATRLDVEGRGEGQPVASNDTPDGRRQNRRVEFEILN